MIKSTPICIICLIYLFNDKTPDIKTHFHFIEKALVFSQQTLHANSMVF